MKSKRCSHCKTTKPITSFAKKRSNRGLLGNTQPYCRPCQSERQRAYYQKNKQAQLQRMYANRRRRKKEIHAFFATYFSKNTCVDCSKKKARIKKLLKNKVPNSTINQIISIMDSDLRNLTFDHIQSRGKKQFTIADMIRDIQPLHKIKSEIKKCVVRCHNCHDIITVKRSKNWRYHAHKLQKKRKVKA